MSKKTPSRKKDGPRRHNTVPTRPRPGEVMSEIATALISAGCPGAVVASLRTTLFELVDCAERAMLAVERSSENTSRAMAVADRALTKVTFLLGVLERIDAEHPGIVRRHFKRDRASLN